MPVRREAVVVERRRRRACGPRRVVVGERAVRRRTSGAARSRRRRSRRRRFRRRGSHAAFYLHGVPDRTLGGFYRTVACRVPSTAIRSAAIPANGGRCERFGNPAEEVHRRRVRRLDVRRDDGGAEPGDRRGDRRGAARDGRGRRARRRRGRRRRGTSGSDKTPKDRMELLLKLADVIDENAEELARLESLNVGKPWWVAVDEPGVMSDNLRFFAGAARNLEGKAAAEYVEGYTSMIRREPLGIVAGHLPVELPAVHGDLEDRAGARGRQRPDHQAGRADAAHDAALRRARAGGHPAGRAAGRDRRRDPRRRRARAPSRRSASSRSPATPRPGSSSRRTPRDTVKRVHLELGGKAPMVVLDDADPATVAEAIKIGGYFNSGQDCTASSRILVSERIYDDVLSETVKAVESLTVGDPATDDDIGMGPVISAEQQERVLGFLERARRREGDDPHRRRGARRPRLLRQADDRHRRRPGRRDRPERGLRPGRHDAARSPPTTTAIEMANDVRYGLAASVFSENVGRAMKVAAQARLRHRLGQRAPLPARLRDAARRLQGVRLRQGHVDLLDGGVHADQARLREAGVTDEPQSRLAAGSLSTIGCRDAGRCARPPARRQAARCRLRNTIRDAARESDGALLARRPARGRRQAVRRRRSPSTGSRSRSRAGRSSRCSARPGCGKTTTLRMIGGFEEPTEGRIFLGDQDVVGLPPYKRDVNTVFQSYALFPHMSIEDNVAFGLERKGVAEGRAARAVSPRCSSSSTSPGSGERKPKQLSGGQQQRVALARALVNHPRVLLLDEPLGALDLKLRKQMQLELKRIQHEVGITFVHVTHDQEEAMTMADTIAVMNGGRIEQLGPPAELYERPRDGVRRRASSASRTCSRGTVEGAGCRPPRRRRRSCVRSVDGHDPAASRPASGRRRSRSAPAGARTSSRAPSRRRAYIGVATQVVVRTAARHRPGLRAEHRRRWARAGARARTSS